MKYFLVLLLLPLGVLAQDEVGFKNGNTLSSVALSGLVTVSCHGNFEDPPSQAIYQCRSLVLEPSAYDYFLGPKGVVADEVILKATREDGSVNTKSKAYDPKSYRSKESFNLWVSTLFQRPLLKEGRNKIDYTLVQSGTIQGQGQFQVLVQRGAQRSCPDTHYSSFDSHDCRSHFSVCERYFYQYNNCTVH